MRLTTITVTDDGALCVDAPFYEEIVARLKAVCGRWEPEDRVWIVPAAQGDRLLAALWRASYSYPALCLCFEAEAARAARFAKMLRGWGITLMVVGARVVLVGESVSPVLQEEADRLGTALVDAALMPVESGRVPKARTPAADEASRLEVALVAGMHNAAEAERKAKQRAVQARVARRRMMEQMELWDSREISAVKGA